MAAEKRRRLDDADDPRVGGAGGADAARVLRPLDTERQRQQGPHPVGDSDPLHRSAVGESPRPRLPSVASFLHPRMSESSGLRGYSSGGRSLPQSPTASHPSVATLLDPTRTTWAPPPARSQLSTLEGDSPGSLPATAPMQTRRRFSPRSRLRASKRLGGQPLPPWSRPVGLSLASAVRAHALLPRESDRFASRPRDSQPYARYQRSVWNDRASPEEHYRLLSRMNMSDDTAIGSAGGEEKSSRYLREVDRQNILARIERGEKQSALAKEFRVTRAAICNLKKHREQITTRACDDLLARHPKRARPSVDEDSDEGRDCGRDENIDGRMLSSNTDERKAPDGDKVHVVESPAVSMLGVLMRETEASELAFRHHSARMMVCLIEEAVAWMYTRQQRVVGSREDEWEPARFMLDEYYTRRPPCGVTVDEFGPLFQDKFRSIDPTWRCGVIEFQDTVATSSEQLPVRMDLPRTLPACSVFLLLSFARDGGCQRLHQSVRILIDHGVVEELLCLVALGISRRAVHLLHAEFPRLRVATASLEQEVTEDRCGLHDWDGRGAEAGFARLHLDGQGPRTPTERLAKLEVSGGQ